MSTEQLLRTVAEMPMQEFDAFVTEVLALRAKRNAPHLSRTETDLLLKVNQGLPASLKQRYDDLLAKRRVERLTPTEHTELLDLTDEVEALEAERLAALADLARLWRLSLTELMKMLGLEPPTCA